MGVGGVVKYKGKVYAGGRAKYSSKAEPWVLAGREWKGV